MSQSFFSVEQTAKFFGVPVTKIAEWLGRQELIATLQGYSLLIGADAIADMIRRMPERAPMGVALGVNRVARVQRIVTSENRGRISIPIEAK